MTEPEWLRLVKDEAVRPKRLDDDEPGAMYLVEEQVRAIESWAARALEHDYEHAIGVLSACLLWRSSR